MQTIERSPESSKLVRAASNPQPLPKPPVSPQYGAFPQYLPIASIPEIVSPSTTVTELAYGAFPKAEATEVLPSPRLIRTSPAYFKEITSSQSSDVILTADKNQPYGLLFSKSLGESDVPVKRQSEPKTGSRSTAIKSTNPAKHLKHNSKASPNTVPTKFKNAPDAAHARTETSPRTKQKTSTQSPNVEAEISKLYSAPHVGGSEMLHLKSKALRKFHKIEESQPIESIYGAFPETNPNPNRIYVAFPESNSDVIGLETKSKNPKLSEDTTPKYNADKKVSPLSPRTYGAFPYSNTNIASEDSFSKNPKSSVLYGQFPAMNSVVNNSTIDKDSK